MASVVVDLQIGPEALKTLYRGGAPVVVARALDGRRIRFPASHLRPYISADGVAGRFCLEFDSDFKLTKFYPVDPQSHL